MAGELSLAEIGFRAPVLADSRFTRVFTGLAAGVVLGAVVILWQGRRGQAPATVGDIGVLIPRLGVEGLWPLPLERSTQDLEHFFDMIEVLHDLVAAPRSRWMHSYEGCGYHHHGDFSTALGREVYRWSVNRILDRTDLGLRLAEEGEDQGRLVAVTDDARTELANRMAERSDAATGNDVRHALALFRGRDAGLQEKRSACIALAGVLENRRSLL